MKTLNEGNTPFQIIPDLNKELEITNLIFKREDLNPTGSHKDRYISYSIPKHIKESKNSFVISSTGNASISATKYCHINDIKLTIFISPKTPINKIKRIYEQIDKQYEKKEIELDREISLTKNITLIYSNKAVSSSIKYSNESNSQLLRGSTDIYGYQGYMNISNEIYKYSKENNYEIDNIYIPCSSGTTAYGIYKGYENIKKEELDIYFKIPKINIIQTESVNTIAREYDKDFSIKEISIAQAISDKVSHRYKEVIESINNTNGYGWIVSDKDILNAQSILNKYNIYTSNEGAMTLAAILKAKKKGFNIDNTVCIITGR